MKEKIVKMFKKYLPDIIVIIGVWVASYNLLRPTIKGLRLPSFTYTDYHTGWKVFGIVLIAIGIDIAIRRYFNK